MGYGSPCDTLGRASCAARDPAAATTHRPCSYPPSVAAAFEAPCTCGQVRVRVTVAVTVSGRVRMERVEAHLTNPIRQTPTPCTDAACRGRLATRRARARWVAAHSWTRRFAPTGAPPPSPPSTRAPALLRARSCWLRLRLMCSARLLGRWGPRVRERRRRRASLRPNPAVHPSPNPCPTLHQRPNRSRGGGGG